ncbi:MAG: c-type cytochrome biogenesis protein CcmI [Betaproteobacteria bacterium]|nr:c-type cytochrome biogenesis protein CcmI [Betaproteobacteria bacterium]
MPFDSDPLLFWLLAAAMTALALAFLLPRLWRGLPPRAAVSRAATNADAYRAQLIDLERERDAGRLTVRQHAEARTDLERRLLVDAAEEAPRPARTGGTHRTAVVVSIALPVLAAGLYALFGDPDALRSGRADREFVGGYAERLAAPGMRDELLRHLERNPRDGRGWVLLARFDFAADRFADAALAFEKALSTAPKVAADAGIWCEYADALGMAQGGRLAGKPREVVMRALALSPAHPRALEMAGSAAYELREFESAAGYWRQLLAQMPEGSAAQRELAAAIARAERLALVAGSMAPRAAQ